MTHYVQLHAINKLKSKNKREKVYYQIEMRTRHGIKQFVGRLLDDRRTIKMEYFFKKLKKIVRKRIVRLFFGSCLIYLCFQQTQKKKMRTQKSTRIMEGYKNGLFYPWVLFSLLSFRCHQPTKRKPTNYQNPALLYFIYFFFFELILNLMKLLNMSKINNILTLHNE